MPMSQFTGRNLVCIRGGRRVFSGLDFSMQDGGALVLVGPNGSGKSSLLRLMSGLLRPASGSLVWDGQDTAEDPEAHNARLHYVGHLDAVKPVLSVAENLEFWTGLRSSPETVGKSVLAALETFAIAHLAGIPGKFLSAGQKRRVTLARIVSSPAALWLLDEPTTALDVAAIEKLELAIRNHRNAGGMVVVSTHAEIGLEGAEVLDMSDFAAEQAVYDEADW